MVTRYCKQLLPNYAVFDEKRYFEQGDQPCVTGIEGIPVGITICEDIWEPGPAAQSAAAGAGVLVNLNASPFHAGKRDSTLTARLLAFEPVEPRSLATAG